MASGDTLLLFLPVNNEPPASNPATPDLRNVHPVLDFDDTTKEKAVFTGVMPQGYGGGGLTCKVGYSHPATSGDVDLDIAFERIGDQQLDIDADSFAAVNVVDGTTVPSTTGNVDVLTVTFTDGADMDSVAAGEMFRVSIEFDSAGTATGDIEFHYLEIRET